MLTALLRPPYSAPVPSEPHAANQCLARVAYSMSRHTYWYAQHTSQWPHPPVPGGPCTTASSLSSAAPSALACASSKLEAAIRSATGKPSRPAAMSTAARLRRILRVWRVWGLCGGVKVWGVRVKVVRGVRRRRSSGGEAGLQEGLVPTNNQAKRNVKRNVKHTAEPSRQYPTTGRSRQAYCRVVCSPPLHLKRQEVT